MSRKSFFTRWFIRFVIGAMAVAALAWPISAGPPLPANGEPSQKSPPLTDEFMPGEILVKFKPAVGQLSAQRSLARRGLGVMNVIPSLDVLRVSVAPGQELAAVAVLRGDAGVLYAEPNYIAYALDTHPNDYYYVNNYQWGLAKISAPAAWDMSTGSSSVVIAIVDTGIDLQHPDFGCPGKLTAGYDFYNGDSNPDDDNGHGSHVAGIAAACTNNSTGVAGVAWGARLMPVKVLRADGNGLYSDVAAGIHYAVDNGADIVNLSLGGPCGSQTLNEAVQYAYNHGVLVVAATGNNNGPVLCPAAYPEAMAVAATDSSDQRAWFSNYGPETDVSAPGVSIYSTVIASYGYKNGTSMATPHVAGLAALVWSVSPGLGPAQVRNVIESSADDLGAGGHDDYFGYGRINARRALEGLVSLQTTPEQVSFMIDDDSGPYPPAHTMTITTDSSQVITWTASISPGVAWLAIAPPASGAVSAAAPDSFSLVVPARPGAYGVYTATVVVTATLTGSSIVSTATSEARIHYVPDFYKYRFPIISRNWTP